MSSTARRLDDNLEVRGDAVHCRRCGERIGTNDVWLERAVVTERPAVDAPTVVTAPPELYVDATIVLRQAFCPGCLTVLSTEIIATEHRGLRLKRVGLAPGARP